MDDYKYQWEVLFENNNPKKDLKNWFSNYGAKVINRDSENKAKIVELSVLIDNPEVDVYLIGEFNNWSQEETKLQEYKFKKDKYSIIGKLKTDKLRHKAEYKFLVINRDKNEKFVIQDPAGYYFTNFGNTVFWDFEDPSSYKQKYDFTNNFNRSIKIIQTDLPGLVSHFANKSKTCGKDIELKNTYKFIAESGVIEEIKRLGFNAVQFLPFAQSIDGDNWKFRYLVPFQFAIQKNWGTPDDFAYMIDMFHKSGIAVIGDFILGHMPHKDYSIFGQSCKDHGLHQWKKKDSENSYPCLVYMKEETPWGTMRVDFDSPYVRDFLISSCIHFMKYYKVDGFRVDNVDGILRTGPAGDGPERENGRTFLRELNSTIYSFNPSALIDYEAHFFFGDNAKMLVAPIDSDDRALGATAYNSSRMTHYFHKKYMFNSSEETTVWVYRDITSEKEWGKSNSTVADFHNHDAAAGLMHERCTGAYAYDCMTESDDGVHIHAIGKIKVMEAIISFACEGRTLDLLQTFLLQPGTFEHNSSIEWFQTFNQVSKAIVEYKKDVNNIMDDKAFWPKNVDKRSFLNIDDKNKVLVIERKSEDSNFVIVINTSGWKHYNYRVGVKQDSPYEVCLNSDELKYAGFGLASYPKEFYPQKSDSFELLDKEIILPTLSPYEVLVLKSK